MPFPLFYSHSGEGLGVRQREPASLLSGSRRTIVIKTGFDILKQTILEHWKYNIVLILMKWTAYKESEFYWSEL